jgi:transcriptional regulator with XRE-family HTH domain
MLRAWREQSGLSQAAAAERVGVSQATWSDWEAGKKCPQIAQAIRLEKEMGLPVTAWEGVAEAQRERAKLRRASEDARVDTDRPSKTGTEG